MKKEETIGTVLKELREMKTEMNVRFDLVEKRFAQVDQRFDDLDDRLEVVAITAMHTQEIIEQLIPRLPVARRAYSR